MRPGAWARSAEDAGSLHLLSVDCPRHGTCARPRVKVCCIKSVEEADGDRRRRRGPRARFAHAERAGVISDEAVAEIAALPPGVDSFLLGPCPRTSRQSRRSSALRARARPARRPASGRHAGLRAALPGVKLVQVIHVTGPASVEQAEAVAPLVDAPLLDSGNPALEVKEPRRHGPASRLGAVEADPKCRRRPAVPGRRPAPRQRPRGSRDRRSLRSTFAHLPGRWLRPRPDKLERFMTAARQTARRARRRPSIPDDLGSAPTSASARASAQPRRPRASRQARSPLERGAHVI